jgi:RimJ/RimL family protein N-acetyltransferase
MLRGDKVGLRARHEDDAAPLKAALYDDVAIRMRTASSPWVPVPTSSEAAPYRVAEPTSGATLFSVVDLARDEALAGEALLWGIDLHNRSAHVGVSLIPECRGRSLGTDVVRVLCSYGFCLRGLQRLQIETLADNAPMIAAATRVGFVHEAVLRRAAWVNGAFVDEVILGLLDNEWRTAAGVPRASDK